jgi:hypothetical protein
MHRNAVHLDIAIGTNGGAYNIIGCTIEHSSDQILSAEKPASKCGSPEETRGDRWQRIAGIAAARALKRSNIDILLLDQHNHHIFQPLLYQVATAVLARPRLPRRSPARASKKPRVLLAEVKGITGCSRR